MKDVIHLKKTTYLGNIKGKLFKEEGKRWDAAWKDSKALAKWIELTSQTIKSHTQTQQWEHDRTLTQQGLFSMLMQI